MAAPKGNKFWEFRSRSGPLPKYDNPDDLWKDCVKYFEWNEKNPLQVAEPVKFQGKCKIVKMPRLRAMTIYGLTQALGITHKTWVEWREKRKDLSKVIEKAEEIIYRQKFEGASADLLNSNIIARDLGLSDKQHLEHTGKDGESIKQDVTVTFIDSVKSKQEV